MVIDDIIGRNAFYGNPRACWVKEMIIFTLYGTERVYCAMHNYTVIWMIDALVLPYK